MPLPQGFTAMGDAKETGGTSNFIGVLTQLKKPVRAQGGDWLLEFTIQDDFTSGKVGAPSGICCRFYKREEADLPKPGSIGDMVLIRDITFKNVFMVGKLSPALVSNTRSTAAVLFFPSIKLPQPQFSTAYAQGGQAQLSYTSCNSAAPPSAEERLAIINLNAAFRPFSSKIKDLPIQQKTPAVAQYKRRLIQDVDFDKYCDIVCEVIKFWSSETESMDVWVTDYTTNTNLKLYEKPEEAEFPEIAMRENWPGPFGQMTMAIRMWEPHASNVRKNIKKGDFVLLQNVHAKLSKDGKLEGAMHQDHRYPDKVCVRKVMYEAQLKELKERKHAYEIRDAQAVVDRMYKGKKAVRDANNASAKESEKKKAQKKALQRQRKEKERKDLEQQADEQETVKAGINPHIRAGYGDIQLSTVEEIMNNPARRITSSKGMVELPFVNTKYRTRLRVVDFSPHSLHDFTRSMADPSWNTSLKDLSLKDKRRDDSWQWGFTLLVEEAIVPIGTQPQRFPLFVTNDSGEYLLKLTATDLRNPRSQTLNKLEEKLFILWGNLLEAKKELEPKGIKFPLSSGDERLQNTPFECCIEEYGAQVPKSPRWPYGFQRMHKMCHTTIMD